MCTKATLATAPSCRKYTAATPISLPCPIRWTRKVHSYPLQFCRRLVDTQLVACNVRAQEDDGLYINSARAVPTLNLKFTGLTQNLGQL